MTRLSLFIGTVCSAFTISLSAQTNAAPPIVNGGFPLVSPSAPRILFESNRTGKDQLWIISADGTGERQLTTRDGYAGAQWAPDGKSIFYSVTTGDSSRLYELWPDSARERMIGVFPGRAPQLSPARDKIIYDVGPWTASHLVLADGQGRRPRQVTDDSVVVWLGVWSPDARRIAYTVSKKSGMSVWVMNADGTRPHQVTRLTPEEGRAQMPSWSPDSHHLAFQANPPSPKGKSTLWLVDLQTTGALEIAAHKAAYLDETPSWFSDGRRLAFQSNRSGRMEIWTMNIDGTELVQVTGRR
jgi:Tol biopolymer transport system component